MMGWGSFSGGGGGGGIDTAGNGLTLNGTEVDLGGTLDTITEIDVHGNLFEIVDSTGSLSIQLDPDDIMLGAADFIRIGAATVYLFTPGGLSFGLSDPDLRALILTPSGLFVRLDDQAEEASLGDRFGNLLSVNGYDNAVMVTSNNPIITKNFWVVETILQDTFSADGTLLSYPTVLNKLYRVSRSFTVTSLSGGGTVSTSVNWTDITGQSQQFLDGLITATGNQVSRSIEFTPEPPTTIDIDLVITGSAMVYCQISIESQLLA
jgi:hypothetical protein